MPRTRTLRLENITLDHVELALHDALPRGGKTLERRRGVRVTLHDSSGLCGRGEALPLPSAGTEPMHDVAEATLQTRQDLLQRTCTLEELLKRLEQRLRDLPATRCAFDVAAHDLEARVRGVPVAARLDPEPARRVEVNALVGAHDPGVCVREAEQALLRGYRTLKLKLGNASAATDVQRVQEVRAAVGPDVRLRVDANGAWSRDGALHILERIAPFAIELAEQPTPPLALDDLAWLHARSPVPVAADESLATAAGRARLLTKDLASVAIVKPMVLGGLSPALDLCRQAAARGLRVVVTTTLDGPIATAAALHLAAAGGSPTLAHGLASCEVVDADFPDALVPRDGVLHLSPEPGLGDLG